ncbi:hypothetical protein ACIGXM_03620 [Kitasatospora sp. NPDC052896]|uniref:hypothetical protein n=1 Tax=Kitasatospora sp. NPDC052896 TaxID=3364061 RepID=UPI0037C6960A
MQLAIDDVVRDRSDMTLGTVAGIANQAGDTLVVVQLSDGELRRISPVDLDVVGRCSRPASAARNLVTVAVMLVAVLAAVVGCGAEMGTGGGWLLAVLTGLGAASAVMGAFQLCLRMTAPRRIRV